MFLITVNNVRLGLAREEVFEVSGIQEERS